MNSPTKIDLKAMRKTAKKYQETHAQYKRHTAKRGNKPNAIVLTTKSIEQIILCLESARRAGDLERRYLGWLIDVLQAQLPQSQSNIQARKRKGK